MTFGRNWLAEWPLDPAVTYLNHGTVGVTPNRVRAVEREIRDAIEREPARFMLRELSASTFNSPRIPRPRLRAAADVVAAFLGARGDDLVFVDNTTTGINAVLRSFPLGPGDEVLVSDLGYGGMRNAVLHVCRERGAAMRTVSIPPPFSATGLADAFVEGASPNTRLAVVDHISAESALVFPVAEIARRLKARGVAVVVDGAHAPGSIPLDIPSLGADWYVGNLHKWAWVPRSSGVLWASPERQAGLHPTVISWGLDGGMTAEFDAVGTRDPTSHLAAPAALALFDEWGRTAVQQYNHALAWRGAHFLAERWGTAFDTPEDLIGTMATVTLPEAAGATREAAQRLRDALLFEDRIEVQMHAFRGRVRARVSAQIYNDLTDIERLADAVVRRVPALSS
jgi:isopenicillin-N epimerase